MRLVEESGVTSSSCSRALGDALRYLYAMGKSMPLRRWSFFKADVLIYPRGYEFKGVIWW